MNKLEKKEQELTERINWGTVLFDISIVFMTVIITIYFDNSNFLFLLFILGLSESHILNKKDKFQ